MDMLKGRLSWRAVSPGLTLLLLLLALLLGLLLVRRYDSARAVGAQEAMLQDLRHMATMQEAHRAAAGVYSTRLTDLPGLILNRGVYVDSISAGRTVWFVRLAHTDTEVRCEFGALMATPTCAEALSLPAPARDRNAEPVAAPDWTPALPLAGTPVQFDARASADPDGRIQSFEWDFGDDSTDEGELVTHTFRTPGTYRISLLVTDDRGGRDRVAREIEVLPLTAGR